MITFDDFEKHYQAVLADNPKVPKCSVRGCTNPADDSACAYHRLLFDFWMYEVCGQKIRTMTQRGRRRASTNWRKKTGKEACDAIVLDMAQNAINWYC